LRGDDGVGPALVARLHGRVDFVCIDAGTVPENYLGKIVKEQPDTILIVDAAHLGAAPGHWELLKKGDVVESGLTTHSMSPKLVIEYLETETRADIYLLAIQAEAVAFGAAMSPAVSRTLDQLYEFFVSDVAQPPPAV